MRTINEIMHIGAKEALRQEITTTLSRCRMTLDNATSNGMKNFVRDMKEVETSLTRLKELHKHFIEMK